MKNSALKPNYRILIIDDNPAIHDDFRKILCPTNVVDPKLKGMEAALFDETPAISQTLSFELDSAYQGQEGLEMVKQALAENRPYAMAFVDVRMPPGWDGVETIARIWEAFPELQIVVCTAYSDYSWEELRLRVGQPDNLLVLKKPFDNVEVQQLAHALTKKWLLGIQANYQLAELEAMVQRRTAELAKTLESLTATEERFSKAFHASPIASGIQTLNERRFVDVNDRFITLTGYSREELIGPTSNELSIWQQPELVSRWLVQIARNEEVREQATKVLNKPGAMRDVLVSAAPVSLGGKAHVLLLAQDISERLLLERQLLQAQKMDGIGQLAAGVAHDFNNILAVIQGYAGMMQLDLDKQDPSQKSINQILNATNRAVTLIRQLLMFSRKQPTQFRSINLDQILSNSLAMMDRLTGAHIKITLQPGHELPAIRGDESMIDQIVLNLAVNARDAMPKGGRIQLSTAVVAVNRKATPLDPEDRHGNYVCLTFSDSGCGVDEKILSRIFEPFFTTKEVGKGTGLGLATVLGIMKQHQGWLEVESAPNKGTTFRLYFLLSEQPVEKPAVVVDSALNRGSETILVVEDEETLLDLFAQVLTLQGYKVLTARSGRHALEVWKTASQEIDLLMTDMVMPEGIMGSELAEITLAQKPSLKVILTSGYSPEMAGKEILLMKGIHFLAKPFSIGKIAQFVRQCLDA